MTKIITFLIVIYSGFCYSQSIDKEGVDPKIDPALYDNLDIVFDINVTVTIELDDCPFTIDNAIQDIKSDSMKLVVHGGFSGLGDMDKVRSEEFQKKYKVTFKYLGCIRTWKLDQEDTHGYNKIIFEHLTSKYGENVRQVYKGIWN